MFHNAVQLSHHFIELTLSPGDACVDATMGNGHDTLFLSELVGENGMVYAFDIQTLALESTKKRLGDRENAKLILDSHANMSKYVDREISAVMFNLGWLPGGDHNLITMADDACKAINAALELLKPGGIITVCAYLGDELCNREVGKICDYMAGLNSSVCSVLCQQFVNQQNCPPKCYIITKN